MNEWISLDINSSTFSVREQFGNPLWSFSTFHRMRYADFIHWQWPFFAEFSLVVCNVPLLLVIHSFFVTYISHVQITVNSSLSCENQSENFLLGKCGSQLIFNRFRMYEPNAKSRVKSFQQPNIEWKQKINSFPNFTIKNQLFILYIIFTVFFPSNFHEWMSVKKEMSNR